MSGLVMEDEESAEISFLCGLLELASDNPDRARACCRKVRADDFADEVRRTAFLVIDETLSCVEEPKWPDYQQHERWDADIRLAVAECIVKSTGVGRGYSLGIERFARLVRQAATRRKVREAADDLRHLAVSRDASSAELQHAAEMAKEAAAGVESGEMPETLSDAIAEYLEHESTPKIETAFSPLDRITGGGLPVGGLTVFAAPPSVGKSALALQATLGAMSRDESLRVVWAMGEMTKEAFARRAICHWSTTRSGRRVTMFTAEARDEDARGTAMGLAEVMGRRMTIVPPPLAIGRIEDAVVEVGARLLVIDYIQLCEMEAADRRAEIDGIVKRVRRLSLEHNVSVLAISNVAKSVAGDTRIGAIGKESSELDFASDLFLLGIADEDRDQDGNRMVRWACKKNRHGPCEDIVARFDGAMQTFFDADAVPAPEFHDWRPR